MPDPDSYFARIGYAGPRTAAYEVLAELQRLHPAAIAFENLSTMLGLPVPLDAAALEEKLVLGGRGGYCFEQNLLFADVLESLGFRVRALAARVLWDRGEEDARQPLPVQEAGPRTHMLLLVQCGGRTLLCDVGFGGLTLSAPLALAPGEQATPHETFRVLRAGAELTLQARLAAGWRSLYRFDLQPQTRRDIEVLNHYIATHPASPMREVLRAARCAPHVRYALLGNSFTVRDRGGGAERRVLRSAAELRAVLERDFAIAVPRDAATEALLERTAAQGTPPPQASRYTAASRSEEPR